MKKDEKTQESAPSIFAYRLNAYMKQHKITNHWLALKLYVSDSAVSGWRTDHREPGVQTVTKICLVLHISADYLLGLSDVPTRI